MGRRGGAGAGAHRALDLFLQAPLLPPAASLRGQLSLVKTLLDEAGTPAAVPLGKVINNNKNTATAAKYWARSILPNALRSFSSHLFHDVESRGSSHCTDGTLKCGGVQGLAKATELGG